MTPEVEQASAALNEAMEPTAKEIAELASRYQALRDVTYLTADGDKIDAKDYDTERAYLNKCLKQYVERHGPLHVEGIGTLRLQDRRETVYDLAAVMDDDPVTFARMVALGCLKVDTTVMKAQVKAGNVLAPTQRMEQVASRALIIEQQ